MNHGNIPFRTRCSGKDQDCIQLAEKRSNGDALLKLEQMALALTGKGGDKTMLVWLGKQRLGQREDPHYESTFNGELASILDLFKNVRTQEDFEKKNKDVSN